uniref:Uncharacterized protein n=1 Tax=Pseudoalteromonas luteoviolacea TaxID=43657 RepID=A0A023Q177_9GAMM|nr:hypothetical protein [Pseudoalteromonas luteoviolacea]
MQKLCAHVTFFPSESNGWATHQQAIEIGKSIAAAGTNN